MAGYCINMDSYDSVEKAVLSGVYSTRLREEPAKYWRKEHEATFADYVTMRAGDKVFFFVKRKIYGIGELIDVAGDCRYLNFPSANRPEIYQGNQVALFDAGINTGLHRWICLFKPKPAFFLDGIDMDEALTSEPEAFRTLRVMAAVSFIKLDDREAKALENVLLRRNEEHITGPDAHMAHVDTFHASLTEIVSHEYQLNSQSIVASAVDRGLLKHEMALECCILDQLQSGKGNARKVFGEWSYLTHQVPASPFKPVHWMDKIDIFGYRYIKGYEAISKYFVCEVKRGPASKDEVNQLMKYVDWVSTQYSGYDYSQVEAYLVASEFDSDLLKHVEDKAKRGFTVGSHPARPQIWDKLKLIRYRYQDGEVIFNQISIR